MNAFDGFSTEELRAVVGRIHAEIARRNAAERVVTTPRAATRDIIRGIADLYGVSLEDLIGPRRNRDLAWPRQHAYAAVRHACPNLSLPAIGKLFGGRDHTTILHGIRAYEKRAAAQEQARAA